MALTACCLATACAGPVRTRYGSLPAAVPSPQSANPQSAQLPYLPLDATPIPLSSLSLAASAANEDTRRIVTSALRDNGIGVDDQSPYELHIGLSARPDPVGVFTADGGIRAAPRKQRLLQSCRNNGYRLALAVSDRRSGTVIADGWAEESHCTASLNDILPVLARQSVAMLTQARAAGSSLRWTQD